MKKEINKNRIVKYLGSSILSTALLVGAGAVICESNIKHTEEICPFTKLLSKTIELSDGNKITYGLIHQLDKMQDEYKANGENVIVAYEAHHQDKKEVYKKELAIETVLDDGTIEYSVPFGYELVVIDGIYYAVKKEIYIESDPYEAIVTYYRDEEKSSTGKTRVLKIGD